VSRGARRLLLCALLATCVFLVPESRAADDDGPAAKSKSNSKAKADDHLDFKKTYAAALREARIRNVPVFVSRHKDF